MATRSRWFSSYLPLNEEARRWEIYCHDLGLTTVPSGSPYPLIPEAHPRQFAESVTSGRVIQVFQLVYITAGSGWFWSEASGRSAVSPGTVFILFPGIRHAYRPHEDTGWVESWIGFGGRHARRLWDNGILDAKNAIFNIGIHEDVVAMFDSAMVLCHDQTPGFQIRLGALVLQIVASIQAAHQHARQQDTTGDLVRRARDLMHEHLEDGLSIEEVAARCNLSYGRLRRAFRQYTGLSPYQYFLQLRTHRAQELLSNPGIQIKEVAARLHFENQYYFARFFKNKTGLTPSEWRDQAVASG